MNRKVCIIVEKEVYVCRGETLITSLFKIEFSGSAFHTGIRHVK